MKEFVFSAHDNPVEFDFTADFDSQVKRLKSKDGGHFRIGGHSYYVLKAMFDGNVIDDYENPPLKAGMRPVRNVRSRIADLRIEWNICIGDRFKEDKPYKEYKIHGRDA